MKKIYVLLLVVVMAACGGEAGNGNANVSTGGTEGLSQAELENGIGPITSVTLGEIDSDLAEQGEEIFKTKCSACHKMDTRYVGPPLEGILDRRTPAYVMNMMLNPEEMLKRHPDVKAMLAEYMTPMPDQQLSEDDARAVVEYLREEAGDD